MSTTRKQQPKAIISKQRHGDFVVELPNGHAVLCDTLAEARHVAAWGGAIVVELRVPMAEVRAARRVASQRGLSLDPETGATVYDPNA